MTTSAGTAPEPLLDLPRLVAGIRWRRRLWLSCALIGLLLGAAVAVILPSGASAVTRILVVHEVESGDASSLSQTDVALFETSSIASAALTTLPDQQVRAEDLVRQFNVEAVAGNVLELTVSGRTGTDAIARAQALADAFIADHVRRTQEAADAEAAALIERRVSAEDQLTDLNGRIATTAAQAPGDDVTAQLEALYAGRAALNSQIQDLGQRAEDASIGAPRVAAGTQIVDAPRAASRSPIVSAVLNALVGLVLGLAVGLAAAAVGGVVRDRPTLRRDIAANLGASVIAQLPAPLRGPRRLWRRSSAVTERRRVATALARTIGPATGGVSLLEIGCPRATALLAVEMAEELAAHHPVVVVDDLPGRDVLRHGPRSEAITTVDGADYPVAGEADERDCILGVGSVGPGTAWMDLARLGSETLLVVRAGQAGVTSLHDVARQLADADILVIGIVLVHPDPRDRTDGTLWDGLHHALRGRVPGRAVSDHGAGSNGTNGYGSNGNGSNGYGTNGNGSNGYGTNGTTPGNGSSGNGSSGNGRAATVDGLPTESFHPDVATTTPDEAVEVT